MAAKHIFTGITSEGGLLPGDFLAALAEPKSGVEGLDPVTYRLSPGERVGDQVNRSWNRLKGCWENFKRSIEAKNPGEPTTTETRERFLLPLFQELDFGRLTAARAIEIDGKSYPVSHGWESVPIHLLGTHVDLDRRTPGAIGAAKASPHSLVQQVLNGSENHLWGIISNGFVLRLLRDNLTLTRIAYVEWDLQTIFDGDLYPEFFLLWLVCHQSRFEKPEEGRPDQCWIEKWKKKAEEKGLRALENLRPGVEKAISSLGAGLVSHKANQTLRSKLSSGELTTQDFYRQILRIVYRMLFLFVAEDRDLLHTPLPEENAGKEAMDEALKARRRYHDYYSISRLRDLTLHRAGTPHPDLWSVFNLVSRWLGSDKGCPELSLPPLGSFLWSPEATADLNECLISNRHFLEAIHALAFVREGSVRRAVDYKNLGSEELGAVYEGLLELHPLVNADVGTFELETSAGHERKTSGSYYTHDSLVQSLLDSALEPVMSAAVKGKEGAAAAEALLKLRICDPAVGSGHFLIAAAHRMARRIAAARTGEEEPSPEATRSALRDVIGRCLYGVDVNPMAAELCKVSLWMEALEPGKPLSFLDHHIRVGNSLLGTTPELIAKGIPDEAFKPIEGDDKKACSALKKLSAAERRGIGGLFVAEDTANQEALRRSAFALEEIEGDTPDEVRRKAETFAESQHSYGYVAAMRLANAWCAAFVIRKYFPPSFDSRFPSLEPSGLTQQHLNDLAKDLPLVGDIDLEVVRLASSYQFFHWHLAFPEVFAKNGFDCVLGNPPWERVKLQEKEWFAERSPEIANVPKAADRKRLIEALKVSNPGLHNRFLEDSRKAEGESHFLRNSGSYPLCGRGDINLYAVFAELMRRLLNHKGRVGCVLPTGIATDDTTKSFFQDVVEKKSLVSLFDFENRERTLFPGVYYRTRFCLFTSGNGQLPTAEIAEFAFLAYAIEDLGNQERRFRLSAEDISLLNPNTRTCPTFQSLRDAELAKAIYRRVPVLIIESQGIRPEQNLWGIRIRRIFDMGQSEISALSKSITQIRESTLQRGKITNSKAEFEKDYIPMFEGKMLDAFNHRAAGVLFNPLNVQRGAQSVDSTYAALSDPSYSPQALYWFPRNRLAGVDPSRFFNRWILGFKDITSVTNERSMIATILPYVATNFTIRTVQFLGTAEPHKGALFVALLNSFVFDYLFRKSLAGLHASDYITHQIPAVPPSLLEQRAHWVGNEAKVSGWIIPRILELTFTAWDLSPFAYDCGWTGPAFRWDEERRFRIRCEIDAAFFNLYLPCSADGRWKIARSAEGAVRDDSPDELSELRRHFPTPHDAVAHIMDTFPIVRRRDEEKHGEYRTKRIILEIYDEMAEAMRTGTAYKTRLDPRPGPPTDALGDFVSMYQMDLETWPVHLHPPNSVWEESIFLSWFGICKKRWNYLEDDQIFPWDGREAFVYALIPYLVQENPGEKFEFYRDAALLASRADRCETLLVSAEQRTKYRQAMEGLDWLQFPDGHKIRRKMVREKLQSKLIIRTDASSGATTIDTASRLPPLPKELKPMLRLILRAAESLDKLQRHALEKTESESITVAADVVENELKELMVA